MTASQSTVRGLRGVLLLGVLFCSPSTGAAEEGGDTPTAHEDKGGAATVADEKPPVGAGAPEGAYHAPSLLQESLPEYPPELREQAVRGDVLLQLDLDETGKPFRISVVETDHPGFSDAAVRAAKKLLFEPARIGAEPVPSRLRYRYQFEPGLGEDGKRRVRHLMAEEGRGETAVVHDSIQVLAERPYRVFRPLREAPPDRPETGTFVLGKRDIELAAGAVSDVAMAVQQLPSVSRQSFFRGSYSVRGSADGEVVSYLDGVPLINSSVIGFLSRFNPNLIDRVTLHAGTQPAHLGGGIGGVTEVDYVAPDNTGFHGLVDLSLITLSGQFSGPLGKKGAPASFVLSVRRSFLDLYAAALEGAGLYEGLGFGFGDVYVRFHSTPGPVRRHFLDATFFWGDDRLRWREGEVPVEDNGHVLFGSARARWRPTDRFEWSQQVWVIYETTAHLEYEQTFHETHRVRPAVRTAIDAAVGRWGRIHAGLFVQGIQLQERGDFSDRRQRPTWVEGSWASRHPSDSPIDSDAFFTELALYSDLRWTRFLGFPLEGRLGLRITPVNATREPLLSPRASLALPLVTGTTFKIDGGLTHQIPLDLGLYDPEFGPEQVKAAKAATVAVAVEQRFDIGLSLRAEAYYRTFSDLVVWSDDPSLLGQAGSVDTTGTGFATGGDLVVGMRRPGWGFQVSYSGLFTRRSNPLVSLGPQTIEPSFSSPHQIKISGDFQFGRRRDWTLAGNLYLAAARPTSPMLHQRDAATGRWHSTAYDYNSLQLGWTNALSLRLEHRAVIKGRVKLSLYIDLSNIRLERNVNVARARLPDAEDAEGAVDRPLVPEIYDAAGIPILPWVGVRAEL